MAHDMEQQRAGLAGWWQRSSPLEKIGAVALTVAVGAGVVAVVIPELAAAAAGGALTGAGAFLLKKGFRNGGPR
jgi:hypothetical protein